MGWGLLQIALLVTLGALLLAAGIQDARHREIGNGKNAAIALLAPFWWLANGVTPWPDLAMLLASATLVFALFCAAFHFGAIGGGDVKLIGALALWLPPGGQLTLLTVMSIVGGAVTLAMFADHKIARRNQAVEVPYGVAIVIAGFLAFREPVFNQFT